jgi:tyrosine-protein kinase Etk/Wzc
VALREAENALRGQQEASGVFDPEMSGKAEYEGLHLVREQLAAIESERVAIANVLSEVERGRLTERQLAAFPSLLRSPAVNTILSQMSALETERTRLLERRTARDPEVVVLTQSIAELERQLLPIARAYSTSLTSQSNELRREERAVESRLARLPGQAEGNLRAQRDVKRLSQTMLALQAQILDARLAAVSEGGQVRQVDVALPPKKIWFPRPLPTLVVSAILGLLAGIVWAIARGAMSSRVRTPVDAERASSLPALDWAPGRPLLLGAVGRTGTLLVVPVGEDRGAAEAVARQLLEHAAEREQRAALVDLSADVTESAPGAAARLVGAAEHSHPFVVVATPGFADRRTSAVLEPPRGTLLVALTGVSRGELGEAVGTVARLGMPCLGLVLIDREQLAAGARRLGRGHDLAVRRSAPEDEGVLTARSNGARG